MKLVSYEFGQVLQLIRIEEMRPFSGVYVPDMVRAIRDRYRFITSPDPSQPPPVEGAKYETGTVLVDGRQIAIRFLGIYNDGILVVCWNTDDADLVTDEFIDWSATTFGLRAPQTSIPRKHNSQVVVDFDEPIDRLLAQFEVISRLYESILEGDQGTKIEAHLQRILISTDPAVGPPSVQTSFLLEQRASTPISLKRYFSAAPLRSAVHLTLLSEIERTIRNADSNA
jgi:hypothetical protein